MAKDKQNPLLKQALRYYRDFGWSVIPIRAGTKIAALRSWKPCQTKRPDEKQLRKWFGSGDNQIAVILGEVSGGLACRDFDAMTEYETWAAAHPDLVGVLPTAQTSRGMHVYFEGHFEGRIEFEDSDGKHLGELRGGKHYCMVPPSVHPGGHIYKWINPLLKDNLLVLDPEQAGFIPKETNVTERTKRIKRIERVEENKGELKEIVVVGDIDVNSGYVDGNR